MLTFIDCCRLHWWATGCGGGGYPETASQKNGDNHTLGRVDMQRVRLP